MSDECIIADDGIDFRRHLTRSGTVAVIMETFDATATYRCPEWILPIRLERACA